MIILPSHKVVNNTQRANTSLLGAVGDNIRGLQRRASETSKGDLLQSKVLTHDGARVFATSKENLAVINDEQQQQNGRSAKRLRVLMNRWGAG